MENGNSLYVRIAELEKENEELEKENEELKKELNVPVSFEEYEGDSCWIKLFNTEYEDIIWNYYSKEEYWMKHKNDDYFLLIKDNDDHPNPNSEARTERSMLNNGYPLPTTEANE